MAKQKVHLTAKEYEIMKVLWNSDRPLLISELLKMTKNIADNSLHPLISKLIDRGFIKVVGNMRVSKTLSRLYAPGISVDEYAAMQLKEVFSISGKKFNLSGVLSYFTNNNKKKDEVINELETFIEQYKNENNK